MKPWQICAASDTDGLKRHRTVQRAPAQRRVPFARHSLSVSRVRSDGGPRGDASFCRGTARGETRLALRFLEIHTRNARTARARFARSEEHTSELQSHHPISYAVFC